MSYAAKKPWIEVRRKLGPGHYCTYATVHRDPFCVWVLGRWVIGGARVREAWARVERERDDG